MEQQPLFKGRDKRKRGWFWMDNDYLNGYAKYFGAVGTAIYLSLCRHADNETQKCFPAESLIADEIGTSERTIRKYIRLFEKYHILKIEQERDYYTKIFKSNVYTLLDKDGWIKPKEVVFKESQRQPLPMAKEESQRQLTAEPEATNSKSQRQPLPNKETNLNKTNLTILKRERTPAQIMEEFILKEEEQIKVARIVSEKYKADYNFVLREIKKFISYWTEPTRSGNKQRWELEKTFEITRRLNTWFSNIKMFNARNDKRGVSL